MRDMTAKLTAKAKQCDELRRQLAQSQREAARQADEHSQEQEACVARMASMAQESREMQDRMQDRVDVATHERDRLAASLQRERDGWDAEREGRDAERDQLASDRAARESDRKRAVQAEAEASERERANEKLVAELHGTLREKGGHARTQA